MELALRTMVRAFGVMLLTAALATPALAAHPKRKDDASRSSKNGKLDAEVNGVPVVLTYGRPKVKGRSVWGKLVPYGKVWRAGADEATAVSFSKAVKIEGKSLAAGTYALFAIPGEKEWTLVFNKQAEQWGAYSYDESKDALRVKVKPKATKHTEALDFVKAGESIELRWGKLAVPFSVSKG
ncbi:MAG: DUF2911 domain-containing protein [Myxococcota bacterium]